MHSFSGVNTHGWVGVCLPFEESPKLFSKVVVPFYIPIHTVWEFVPVVSHPCQHIGMIGVFNFTSSGKVCCGSHVLICIFLMTNDTEHMFIYCVPSYIFFGEVSVYLSCLFFKWGFFVLSLNYKNIYYRYKSIVRFMFCKCFPPVYGLSFYFFINVFWRTNIFNFRRTINSCMCFI